MLRIEYTIKCPHGIITVYSMRGKLSCGLTRNGVVLSAPNFAKKPIQYLLPFPYVQKARQFTKNTNRLITRAIQAVEVVSVRQSCLLEFCIAGGLPVIQLLESNPAIAMLLALKYQNAVTGRTQKEIVAFAKYSRSDILEYCSYPSKKWVVKLLGKIPPSQCCPHLLSGLKKILQQNKKKHVQLLQHISRLNNFVINIMLTPDVEILFNRNFYNSACFYPETDSDIEAWPLIKEIIRLSSWSPGFTPPKANSVQDLHRIHDICMERFISPKDEFIYFEQKPPSKAKLWKSPIQELKLEKNGTTYGIFPLQSSWELYEEGKRMDHCIYSYTYEIDQQGDHYAYCVVSPTGKEASIMLIQNGVTWRLKEIRGYKNIWVEDETREFVLKWLNDYNERVLGHENRDHDSGMSN